MSLKVSQYDSDEDGNENRINFWLKLENWSAEEAALLFLDVEPHSILDNDWSKVQFLSGQFSHPVEFDIGIPVPLIDETGAEHNPKTKLEEIGAEHLRKTMLDYLKILNGQDSQPPSNWIHKALDKSIDIPWIGYAARCQLTKFPEDLTNLIHTIFDTNNPHYPIELEWTLRAWLFASGNPDRRKPKRRLHDWLTKHSP